MIEPDIPVVEFAAIDGYGRRKMSQDTLYGFHRDAPYPEKTQDMIDAKGVEIIAHLLKAPLPPGKAVFFHHFPVISRETPVLSFDRKIVRRGAGLLIHMV